MLDPKAKVLKLCFAFNEMALPIKRVPNNRVEVIIPWLPAENLADATPLCHEGRGIARPPRAHTHGEVALGGALDRCDHLEHGEAATIAAVQNFATPAFAQMVERGEMC